MLRFVLSDSGDSTVTSPTSTEVKSPTSTRTATEVRSPTSTATEVRSPTSTSTEVRSPTSTSTDAYTQGNVTVTGGAGAGHTSVTIYAAPKPQDRRADSWAHRLRSKGAAWRMTKMIDATMAPRVVSPMPSMQRWAASPRADQPIPGMMRATNAPTALSGVVGLSSLGFWILGGVALVAGAWFWTRKA